MVPFHRLLIGTAIVFCVVFAAWGFNEYQHTGTTWSLASAIAFALFAVGFAVYLAFLKRWLGER
jgi:quinol-cytochrome oxidoreductase complex cytochrome b subunit